MLSEPGLRSLLQPGSRSLVGRESLTALQRILALSPSGQVFLDERIDPLHWFDFVADRCLYASADVGGVSGATGYSFARASAGYYTNADGTLTSFASGALRRGDRGVLIEGSRTNLATRSQEFNDAAWTKTNAAITADSIAAPDGAMTADTLVDGNAGGTGVCGITRNFTLTAAAHTVSVFVKASGLSWFAIAATAFTGGTTGTSYYDLTNGVMGATNQINGSIVALGGGWYRCQAVITPDAGDLTGNIAFYLSDGNGDITVARNGTSSLYIWGAQLEAASFPSSYIPTTTASATRAADVLTCTAGVSYPLSLWAEFERAVDTGADEAIIQLRDTATERSILLGALAATDAAQLFAIAGGSTAGSSGVAGAVPLLTVQKIAGRFAADDFRAVRNGTLGGLDSAGILPNTPSTIGIGHNNGSNQPFGYIRRAAIFNSALSDANLQSVTT